MPVLTVTVGRSATGRRLAGARAAKAATPLVTRQALFEQAGMIAAANLGELLDTAALLASQPVPAGGRVGVVSNTRGAAVLAADACGDAGLQVAALAGDTQRALRDMLGREALVAGPVDTTVLVAPGRFRRCLELVGADPGVDAVLALTTTTAGSDLVPEVGAARLPVPIAAAVLDQIEVVRLLPGPGEDSPAVPAYAYAESAARALGHAARYGTWRATPPGRVPDLEGLRQDRARELVAGVLAGPPRGGWLALDPTVELLGCYGVPLADSIGVITEDAAAAAAARFGGPVALRADVPGLLRTSDAGDVLTGLHGADEVRRGFRSLKETFGRRLAGVIVQPVVTGGVEVSDQRAARAGGRPAGAVRARRRRRRCAGRPGRPARSSHRLRRRRPDPVGTGRPAAARAPRGSGRRPRRAAGTCCCGSPGWPMTCRRSPSSS